MVLLPCFGANLQKNGDATPGSPEENGSSTLSRKWAIAAEGLGARRFFTNFVPEKIFSRATIMQTFLRFLFPVSRGGKKADTLLLLLRLAFGLLFMTHGCAKLAGFAALSETFPDPLGVGHVASLVLAIFGELACSLAFVCGFLHRLCLLPMIFTMLMATFVIHAGGNLGERELSLLYLLVFLFSYAAGPGKFSIDRFLGKRLCTRG